MEICLVDFISGKLKATMKIRRIWILLLISIRQIGLSSYGWLYRGTSLPLKKPGVFYYREITTSYSAQVKFYTHLQSQTSFLYHKLYSWFSHPVYSLFGIGTRFNSTFLNFKILVLLVPNTHIIISDLVDTIENLCCVCETMYSKLTKTQVNLLQIQQLITQWNEKPLFIRHDTTNLVVNAAWDQTEVISTVNKRFVETIFKCITKTNRYTDVCLKIQ